MFNGYVNLPEGLPQGNFHGNIPLKSPMEILPGWAQDAEIAQGQVGRPRVHHLRIAETRHTSAVQHLLKLLVLSWDTKTGSKTWISP